MVDDFVVLEVDECSYIIVKIRFLFVKGCEVWYVLVCLIVDREELVSGMGYFYFYSFGNYIV